VLLTLYEYGEADYDWSNQDLLALQRLNESTGAEVLRAGVSARGMRKTLQAHQYAGVVRLRHCTVQILPKIYRATSGDAAITDERAAERSAMRNLLHMLSIAGLAPLREHELAPLLRRNLDWFEILTHLFAAHLAEAWQHGAPHAYQDVEAELPVLKGKWRMSDHLRRPALAALAYRLPVRYAEFSADNALNRVLRYVVERLWHLTRDDDNRHRLADLRAWMDGVKLLPLVTAADARPELVTRLNEHYEPLLNLSRVLLGQGSLQLAAGETNAFGLLLDMSLLFQEFIVHLIARRHGEVLPPALRACQLLPQARTAAQHLARTRPGGEWVFELHPDLALRAGEGFPLLLDTKYKPLPPGRAHASLDPSDLYQAFAYAQSFRCPRVVLLYPQADGCPPMRQSFDVPGTEGPARVDVATVNLRVDLHTELGQFMAELRAILDG
jgi:5-methylcytosine-specific restriction enzyme subunit McrC